MNARMNARMNAQMNARMNSPIAAPGAAERVAPDQRPLSARDFALLAAGLAIVLAPHALRDLFTNGLRPPRSDGDGS